MVERIFSGRLKRPEIPPEEAAYALVSPARNRRPRRTRFCGAAAEILDKIVVENLDVS
jgi:hypothetical protein